MHGLAVQLQYNNISSDDERTYSGVEGDLADICNNVSGGNRRQGRTCHLFGNGWTSEGAVRPAGGRGGGDGGPEGGGGGLGRAWIDGNPMLQIADSAVLYLQACIHADQNICVTADS
jgi:hypothetical protein